jgi:uncharacterized membrane protein
MTTGTHSPKAGWLLPAGLIALSAVPILGGAARLASLTGGQITPENARFFAMPLPVVLHILTASPYCVLGALQFLRRRRRWHRVAGRLIVPCGLIAALSGVWMTLTYQIPDSALLAGFRLVFGSAMALSIALGFVAIRRRDFTGHRAWMIRGYAIGLGAGTQVLTQVPWSLIVGPPGQLTRALLLGAGWVINIAVAEWAIRRHPAPSVKPSTTPQHASA